MALLSSTPPGPNNGFYADHIALLVTNYERFTGRFLGISLETGQTLAESLYHAPAILLSHNTEADPRFNYANLKAQELFGYHWEAFCQIPSRLSAEPLHQGDRQRLLTEVTQRGFIDHYQGIRISKTGQRFRLLGATVWNLFDHQGQYQGQAAWCPQWQFLP